MSNDIVPNPIYQEQDDRYYPGDRPFVHKDETSGSIFPFRSQRYHRPFETINPRHWKLTQAARETLAKAKQTERELANVEAYLAGLKK